MYALTHPSYVLCMQMLSDMVIVNESRVGHSRVMQAFNKPRVYSLTLPMRFQVQSRPRSTPIITQTLDSGLRKRSPIPAHITETAVHAAQHLDVCCTG